MVHQDNRTSELLAIAKVGNEDAVNKLLDRERPVLRRQIQLRLDKRIQRRVGVSDIVQDVLIEANRRLDAYLENPKMPFHLWLRHMARDRIIDAHRRHRVSAKRSVDKEQPLLAPGNLDRSSMEIAPELIDAEMTPAAAATMKELARRVKSSMHLLEDRDREILLLRHCDHLSNREVAERLGLSEPAASMRYLRAVRRLRAVLEEAKLGEN
jgi:RNA polymerase sigma-70 factor (ECF subfamily)